MKHFNKIISLVLSLTIVCGVFTYLGVGAGAVDNVIGDANSDGAVNSFDALMIIRYCANNESLTGAEAKAADVDADGKITSTDALYILHFAIGKISVFPASGEIENHRVEIFGGFFYDPATGKVTNEDGSGLLGFSYDSSDKVFYASNNAWQRTFGYTYFYDMAAPFGICWYDTTRIYFTYDDKDWMIQLWKGQYGWVLVGCEIGLYYREVDSNLMIDNAGRAFYKCADDEMLVKMSLNLYRNDRLLFSRKQQYSWWLTGFTPGALTGWGFTPEAVAELSLDSKITFTDEGMMDAFIGGLDNVTSIQHNVTKKERDFKFVYGENYTVNRVDNSVSFSWD